MKMYSDQRSLTVAPPCLVYTYDRTFARHGGATVRICEEFQAN